MKIVVILMFLVIAVHIITMLCTPFAGIFSFLYQFFRKIWIKHNYVRAESHDGKIIIFVFPKTLTVRINERENNHYKLHIDGDAIEQIKIIASVDTVDTINSAVIKVYVNGNSDNSRTFALKNLPHKIPKHQSQNIPPDIFDSDDDFDKQYFENEVEGYRIWFEDTHYWRR